MKPFVTLGALLITLAACAPLPQRAIATCETVPRGTCGFDRDPLRVLPQPVTLPRRPWTFFPTAAPLNFADARGRRWTAPQGTLTDGASVPRIFVGLVGDPTAREFINAAAMHDAYCGIGNEAGEKYHSESWEDTHRMFHDGLIAGGARPLTARIMFSAVWLGGPRWDTGRVLEHVPDSRRQQAMRETLAFIRANTLEDAADTGQAGRGAVLSTQGSGPVDAVATPEGPRFEALLAFLRLQERRMLDEHPYPTEDAAEEHSSCTGDDCYDPVLDPEFDPTLDPNGNGL